MEQTHSIYILLTDTGSLFTRAIKQYTHAPYNHSSIAFDETLHDMYSFGRKHPLNPVYGGFVREDVYYRYSRYFPNTTCALYELQVDERTVEKIKRVIEVFQTKPERYTYNFVGLIGVVFNYPIEMTASYFCSQFVAEVLRRAGVVLWDKPSALVTPEDFRKAEGMTLLYEGKLLEYPVIQSYIQELDEKNGCYSFGRGFMRALKEKIIAPQHRRISAMMTLFTQKIKFEDVLGRENKKKK